MAVPVTVGGASDGYTGGRLLNGWQCGPFQVGSNYYLIVAEASADDSLVRCFKATDPTSSWTEQDTGNQPDIVTAINGTAAAAIVDGTLIHVALMDGDCDIMYCRFNTSTDAWVDASNFGGSSGNTEYEVYNPSQNGPNGGVGIAIRTNDDIIIGAVYGDTKDMGADIAGVSYHRWDESAGSWTTNVDVAQTDTSGQMHNSLGLVMGSSNQCHFAYLDEQNSDFNIRALGDDSGIAGSEWQLRTERSAAGTYYVADLQLIPSGINYDRGGTEKIAFLVKTNQSTNPGTYTRFHYTHFTDDTSPTISSEAAVTSSVEAADGNDFGTCAFLVADTDTNATNYVVFVDGTDLDIYARTDSGGTTWSDVNSGTRISTNTVTDGRGVFGAIYTRSSTKYLAFLYDDNDQNYYDEYSLGGGSTPVTGTTSLQAALKKARTVTSSLQSAVQDTRTATTAVSAGLALSRTQAASLQSVLQKKIEATTVFQALVQDTVTASTVLTAALQKQGFLATTSLSTAIAASRQATTSLQAALRANRQQTTSLTSAIRDSIQASTALQAALRDTRTATAALDANIITIISVNTALSAAIRKALTTSTAVQAAIQAGRTQTTALETAISKVLVQVTSLDAAVRREITASTSIQAALQKALTAQTALSAVVMKELQETASIDAALQKSRSVVASLNAQIEAAAATQPSGHLRRTRRRYWWDWEDQPDEVDEIKRAVETVRQVLPEEQVELLADKMGVWGNIIEAPRVSAKAIAALEDRYAFIEALAKNIIEMERQAFIESEIREAQRAARKSEVRVERRMRAIRRDDEDFMAVLLNGYF